METKVYTILKNSYQGEHEPFVENFFFANVSSIENLTTWFKKIILSEDVKKVWFTEMKDDINLFYVEYKQSYESEFYHGFSIQVLNLSTSENYIVTEKKDKDTWDKLKKMVLEFIQNRGK